MASNYKDETLYPKSGYGYTLHGEFSEQSLTDDQLSRNVTKIKASGYLKANGTYWSTSNYVSSLVLYWHDNKNNKDVVVASNSFYGMNSTSDSKSVSAEFEVEHNPDGTLSGYIWIKFNRGSTTSIYAPADDGIAMTSLTKLTTIPRATACPNISGIVKGNSINIALNPASSTFKHSVKVEFGNIKGYLNELGGVQTNEVILTSTGPIINFGKEYYAEFTKKSSEGKLILNTYNDNTLIGTKEGKLVISVDSELCKPSATGSVKDINPETIALTGNANVIVKGYSYAEITPTYKASDSDDTKTTISKKYINNVEFTTDNVQVNGAISKDFEITMENSREIDGKSTLSASSLLEYIKLSINATFERNSSVSDDMMVSFNGNFFDDYFDAAKTKKNKLSISWGVKEKGTDTYTQGGNIAASNYTISNNKFSGSDVVLSNPLSSDGKWDAKKAYDFIIYYNDLLVTDEYKISIKRSRPYFYWYADANGENHLVPLDNLDVKGQANLFGDLYYEDTPILTTIDV